MNARQLVERLLEEEGLCASELIEQALCEAEQAERALPEASVHRPHRGRVYVAYFTGAKPGQQISRSTGHTDYPAALALAKQWERQAKEQRVTQRGADRKPTIRVRWSGSERSPGLLTQREVAMLLGMSERGVREVERRALNK